MDEGSTKTVALGASISKAHFIGGLNNPFDEVFRTSPCKGDIVYIKDRKGGGLNDAELHGLLNLEKGDFIKDDDRLGLVIKVLDDEYAQVSIKGQRGQIHRLPISALNLTGQDTAQFMRWLGCNDKVFQAALKNIKVHQSELLAGCQAKTCAG